MSTVYIYIYSQGVVASTDEHIKKCAVRYAFDTNQNFSLGKLSRGEKGKPYFEGGSPEFSVSHSGDYWVCAFSDQSIGLDIEKIRSCDQEKIAERFFHPYEIGYLEKNNCEDFFNVWTAKESFIKFTGEGLSQSLSSFSVVCDDILSGSVENVEYRHIKFDEEYSLCYCCENISDYRLIIDESV